MPDVSRPANGMERQRPKRSGTFHRRRWQRSYLPIWSMARLAPSDDVSTYAAKQQAYGLPLEKGLIRIGLPLPSSAEFIVEAVNDPYDCTTSPINRSDKQLDRHCFGLSPSSSGNQYRLLEHDHVGWTRAEPGAANAGLFAVSLLAVEDAKLASLLGKFRKTQTEAVAATALPGS